MDMVSDAYEGLSSFKTNRGVWRISNAAQREGFATYKVNPKCCAWDSVGVIFRLQEAHMFIVCLEIAVTSEHGIAFLLSINQLLSPVAR